MNFEEEIKVNLRSNNYLTYIYTEEEERLTTILVRITNNMFNKKVIQWDFIQGYINYNNNYSQCKQNPLEALEIISSNKNSQIKVFLLKDFHVFLNDISINRKLKNLYYTLQKSNQYVILSGTDNSITASLKEHIHYIKLPLPNKAEIKNEIRYFIDKKNLSMLKNEEMILEAYKGFSITKIRMSISRLVLNQISGKNIVKHILDEKEKIINKQEGLKFFNNNKSNTNLGGLKNLKNWLKIRSLTFTKAAYSYGVKMPKGILLVGVQGTGKSLSAKTISNEWQLPLVRLDISQLFSGVLGESENKIEKTIYTCTNMAPCILWVDEIDKIFFEQTINNDSGTTQRVTNIFLTWLSEKKNSVFIVATANKINQLPIEMLRKGRFDEIFFVDLPNFKERLSIFQIHLKKIRPLTWNKYNIYYLSKISKGFSGAEIEQCVLEAMYSGFYEMREFTTKDIVISIKNTNSLSKIEKDKILKLRMFGHSGKVKIA